jgi:hypothetical protein
MSPFWLTILGQSLLVVTVIIAVGLAAWALISWARRMDALDNTVIFRVGPGVPKPAEPMFVDADPTFRIDLISVPKLVRPMPLGSRWSEIPARCPR